MQAHTRLKAGATKIKPEPSEANRDSGRAVTNLRMRRTDPRGARITIRDRRGAGRDRWIRASGRGGPDTGRRRRFLHPIRAFRRKEMAREVLQALQLKTA